MDNFLGNTLRILVPRFLGNAQGRQMAFVEVNEMSPLMADRIPLHCQRHCAAGQGLQHPSEMALESLMKSEKQKHPMAQGQGENTLAELLCSVLHSTCFVLVCFSRLFMA